VEKIKSVPRLRTATRPTSRTKEKKWAVVGQKTKLSRKRSRCPHTGADCGEEKNVEKKKRPLSEGAGTAGNSRN
jgi:hypothetical protein